MERSTIEIQKEFTKYLCQRNPSTTLGLDNDDDNDDDRDNSSESELESQQEQASSSLSPPVVSAR